jgi:hypothetical protein
VINFRDDIMMVPHRDAPLIGKVGDRQLFDGAVAVMKSDPATWNAEDLLLVRQVALGNLFFFLKYVAGYSGPYSNLKEGLHMEMCNWRQEALEPGSWNAGFVPRSTYKSSVWTHGAPAWELVRNPDLRVGIFSCILERSLEFMHTLQRTFDSNDMTRELFPDHCITKTRTRDGRWNDMLAVMPNRTRNYPEPSVKAHTAGGSTQGIHVDLADFDDVVGDSQLNSARGATAEMERIGNWFSSSLRTLLISQKESRVTLAATRYSIDDPYEPIMSDAITHDGDWSELEAFYPEPSKLGRWHVYYRSALSDGESIFSESYSVDFLKRLAKDDHWTYVTQYVNNPHSVGTLDFASYTLRSAKLVYEDSKPCIHIQRHGKLEVFALDDCDMILGIDPAASEKRVSTKTSRSAGAVIARTCKDDVVVLDTFCDFMKATKLFDWLFRLHHKHQGRFRQVRLESQGSFKLLSDLLLEEMKRRGEHFYLLPVPAMGDKVQTIKLMLEPFLKRDAFFVIEESMALVKTEFDIFPSSRADLLDAIKLGIAGTHLPAGSWYNDEDAEDEEVVGFDKRLVGAAGY